MAQRLAQNDDDDDSDTGSEPQGSEYHLGRANLHGDKDYCLSDTEVEEMGLEGDDSDSEGQRPRKRRKVSRSSAGLLRDATASVERPRQGRPSLRSRSTQSTYRGKYAQASGILSPASSQATPDETEVRAVLASFEEWPLENASLKRITENGKTTFQVQFDWTPGTKHRHASSTARDRVNLPLTRTSRAKRASAPRAKYTPQEDDLLIELKEGREMLAWPEIYQRFSKSYPGRSVESLQVHYSTKLKSRERL
ncbi:hypothetical protein EDB80DRAFT_256361 [Ilyonectria destructans]|nr:hypothetical protein EDB80DRAFT_256361 [Ilyonectria destructans]